MTRTATVRLLSLAALACIAPFSALAQNAPPTYEADPGVYKIVFEDANFRVIAATWQAGQGDKSHSHTVASVAYALTDCSLKITAADGKVVNLSPKAGSGNTVGMTASHSATNVGPGECRLILIERK
jgi:hypothetical protein